MTKPQLFEIVAEYRRLLSLDRELRDQIHRQESTLHSLNDKRRALIVEVETQRDLMHVAVRDVDLTSTS